jgi:hypothetical protein
VLVVDDRVEQIESAVRERAGGMSISPNPCGD